MKTEVRQNLITYFVFLVIALIGIYYGRQISSDHGFLRVWEFSNLLIMAIGIPFLFLQSRARLPEFWSNTISAKTRFSIPLAIGIVFGVLDVLVIKVIMHPEPYQELPPFLQPFPYSLFLYFSGAFEVEVFYRLIPLTIMLIAGNWFKGGKYYTTFFWVAAVLTSLREPIEQLPDGNALFITYSIVTGFLMNFLQAVMYKKAGFIASLSVRLGHYLVWHIMLGIYVQYLELA
jgi:hypothetical protein